VTHVAHLVHVVVAAALFALGKRVEDGVARLVRRLDGVQHVAHRHAAPFRDARPALDAEVRGDLRLARQRVQRLRMRMCGMTPRRGGTQSARTMRSSAGVSVDSIGARTFPGG
jgi:hypothetical protein